MSAKRPQTQHAKERAAFILGRITREEYQLCVKGYAVIIGQALIVFGSWRNHRIWLRNRNVRKGGAA